MSNWVYVIGSIKINSITEAGMKKVYNLKNKKDLDTFYSNSSNWKHIYKNKKLYMDNTKDIKDFIETLPTPTGSEGDMEMNYCQYKKHIDIWGSDSTASETIDYNIVTQEINHIYQLTEEQEADKNWKNIWFEQLGVTFGIGLFGDLRDTTLDKFKKEFTYLLKNLEKWFIVEDINVTARECWSDKKLIWRYDDSRDKIECEEQ